MSNMKELLARMTWCLSSIRAKVELVDFETKGQDRGRKPLIVVSVVSDSFKSVPVFSRNMIVDDLLKTRDPKLYKSLELAYECYTSDEEALGYHRKCELH